MSGSSASRRVVAGRERAWAEAGRGGLQSSKTSDPIRLPLAGLKELCDVEKERRVLGLTVAGWRTDPDLTL